MTPNAPADSLLESRIQDAFARQFPFTLDDFQQEAIAQIAEGHSVVVCAPTGSGKTLIAEYALIRAMETGRSIFYTTPLKALSNQKFHDFGQAYGTDNVGLLTGDTSINRDAPIVVMTTEIFRNMLYGLIDDSRLLDRVGYVVLDECHYMNDAQRGTVWEESIIYCPEFIQIIALSATVANAHELTDWINEAHHDTRLILSDFRPVPLRFFYYNRKELMPLLERDGQMNRKLKFEDRSRGAGKKQLPYTPNALIEEMAERQMLPAIFFTFSRDGCDKALRDTHSLRLVSREEADTLAEQVDRFVLQYPFLAGHTHLDALRRGVASHHAGLLPALKLLVERLFQQGLIKVVFATETLAAGINMPARATVITSLSKRTDNGHRLLNASEFLQMSGRAGRRGMDAVGYVIVVGSVYEGAPEAALLATSHADPLNSQFTPTYGMVLNLLQRHRLEEVEFLIAKSFGQFTWERRLAPLRAEVDAKRAQLAQYHAILEEGGLTEKTFADLLKIRALTHDSHRAIRTLKAQIKRYGKSPEIATQLAHEQGKLANLESSLREAPCNISSLLARHKRLDVKLWRLKREIRALEKRQDEDEGYYWRRFCSLYELLREIGQLDEADKPTAAGALTGQIRADNELFVSMLIQDGLFEGLLPSEVAGVACALSFDSNRENLYSQFAVSPAVQAALSTGVQAAKRLRRLQEKYRVQVPILLNPLACGLIEAWAQGLPWDQVTSATNIAEGDLVRIVRRTADLLRQFSRSPDMPRKLAQAARAALPLILRDPVREVDMPTSEPEEPEVPEDAPESPEQTA